jgi:DNA-directed RNA polymerase specialized sigma24 family protein
VRVSRAVDARLDQRDCELLDQIRRSDSLYDPGTQRIIARLLAPYEAMIDGIVAARLWRLGDDGVEEGVQRVYEDMLEELETGKTWDVPFRAILAARIEYTCRDVWRERLRDRARETPTGDSADFASAEAADPADAAIAAVTLAQLRAALSDEEWAIIQGTWVEARRSSEVAAQLGISEGALNTRKSRIKAKIARLIADD